MGLPYRGIYSASKGALELITEALRMEVKSFESKLPMLLQVILLPILLQDVIMPGFERFGL